MDNVYQVEKILNKRFRNGVIEYRIKWSGYKSYHNTWEPQQNILDPQLISNYEEQQENLMKRSLKRKMKGEFNTRNGQRFDKIAKLSNNNMDVTIVQAEPSVNSNKLKVRDNKEMGAGVPLIRKDECTEINPFRLTINLSADLQQLNIAINFNREQISVPGAAD